MKKNTKIKFEGKIFDTDLAISGCYKAFNENKRVIYPPFIENNDIIKIENSFRNLEDYYYGYHPIKDENEAKEKHKKLLDEVKNIIDQMVIKYSNKYKY